MLSNPAYLMQFEEIPYNCCLSAWNSSGRVRSSLREVEAIVIEEKGAEGGDLGGPFYIWLYLPSDAVSPSGIFGVPWVTVRFQFGCMTFARLQRCLP